MAIAVSAEALALIELAIKLGISLIELKRAADEVAKLDGEALKQYIVAANERMAVQMERLNAH